MNPVTQPPLRLSTVIVGSIVLSSCASLFVPLPSVMKQFENLFRGFGADLPPLTQWVLAHVTLIWIPLLGSLIAQFVLFIVYITGRSPKVRRAFWMLSFVNIACAVTLVVAMYQPIFKLGAVV